jgi:hypothetical protein
MLDLYEAENDSFINWSFNGLLMDWRLHTNAKKILFNAYFSLSNGHSLSLNYIWPNWEQVI